jgi:hypothetical protein
MFGCRVENEVSTTTKTSISQNNQTDSGRGHDRGQVAMTGTVSFTADTQISVPPQ